MLWYLFHRCTDMLTSCPHKRRTSKSHKLFTKSAMNILPCAAAVGFVTSMSPGGRIIAQQNVLRGAFFFADFIFWHSIFGVDGGLPSRFVFCLYPCICAFDLRECRPDLVLVSLLLPLVHPRCRRTRCSSNRIYNCNNFS